MCVLIPDNVWGRLPVNFQFGFNTLAQWGQVSIFQGTWKALGALSELIMGVFYPVVLKQTLSHIVTMSSEGIVRFG